VSAWLDDCEKYYKNNKINFDLNVPSARLLIDALRASIIYE
jgi:hypothetical protein